MNPSTKELIAGWIMAIFSAFLAGTLIISCTGCASDTLSSRNTSLPNSYISGASNLNEQIDNKIIILEHSR
jgi:hypothetical protein